MSAVLPPVPEIVVDDDEGPPRLKWRWLRKNPTLVLGAVLLVVVALVAIAAPWLVTHDPENIDPSARLEAPSAEHRFGTDALGRDVYSRALLGGRVSLVVGCTVAALAVAFGVVLGMIAGFVAARRALRLVMDVSWRFRHPPRSPSWR